MASNCTHFFLSFYPETLCGLLFRHGDRNLTPTWRYVTCPECRYWAPNWNEARKLIARRVSLRGQGKI